MKRPSTIRRAAALSGALAATAFSSVASAQSEYNYVGPIVTEMAGSSCRAATHADNMGLTHSVKRTWVDNPNGTFLLCPLQRRSVAKYGSVGWIDRVLLNELRVLVEDRSTSSTLSCTVFVKSHTGSNVFSSTLFATQSGGSTTAPTASWTGTSELVWAPPYAGEFSFGINVGYRCWVPGGSMVHTARATFDPNG